MTIKECAQVAALLLNVSDVFAQAQKPESERSEEAKELILLLTQCANIVLAELAMDYFPLVNKEKITSRNGEIKFEDLSKKIIDIFSLKIGGKSALYKELAWGLSVENDGEYEIEYAYAPLKATLEDETEFMKNVPSKECVAYGIAREYCLIQGMLSEATVFDSKFLALASHKTFDGKERKLPARGWFF